MQIDSKAGKKGSLLAKTVGAVPLCWEHGRWGWNNLDLTECAHYSKYLLQNDENNFIHCSKKRIRLFVFISHKHHHCLNWKTSPFCVHCFYCFSSKQNWACMNQSFRCLNAKTEGIYIETVLIMTMVSL